MGKVVDTLQVGQEKPYSISGNYLNVIKSLQLLEIELIKSSDALESHTMKAGTLYDKNFDSIVVKNVGTAPADIQIVSGRGKFRGAQEEAVVTVDTSAGSVPVTMDEAQLNLQVNQQTTGATNGALPKVTLATGETKKLCSINATRKYVKYNILSSETCEYIAVGGSAVDASSGYALERGMVAADETTGELWAHNPSAETVSVWVMEVSD